MTWLNEFSREFLKKGYLAEGETAEQRIEDIAIHAEKRLQSPGFAAKFCEYMMSGYYSLSSPIWANFGRERACPISCFNSYCPDSVSGILDTAAEVGMMTKIGGGTSGYFGDIRCANSKISGGGRSEGLIPFLRIFETISTVCKQTEVRRGSFAAYLPIYHGDIKEFLKIRHPKNPLQHIFPGVCVPDWWMKDMIDGDVDKREIWASVIKSRTETGVPYVFFTDNANKNKPDVYKQLGYEIQSSNLCSEIFLPSNKDESFVCCLSSINLLFWDSIKNTDAVETLIWFLDAVMDEFIEKSESIPHMRRANNFAKRHRALGLGVLGWHSYLQSKMIPFESLEAKLRNTEIFKGIKVRAELASIELAKTFGEPELLKGFGRRNTTLIAVAPTTSSSFILGQVSQSIEPFRSNYYVKDLAKILYTFKNPYLSEILDRYGMNTQTVWESIRDNDGSVQHLDFLSQNEKDVFKTFGEISQREIIIQAASRQQFIDQGQSINLLIDPKTPAKEINSLMIDAWRSGIKSLYYQHSYNASRKFAQQWNFCRSCEG